MKTVSIEAKRLEFDYLLRLHQALAGVDPSQAQDISENVEEHLRNAVAEVPGNAVTSADMANILERLGPPEAMVPRSGSARTSAGSSGPARPRPANIPMPQASEEDLDALDSMRTAWLVCVISVYIPVIQLYLCSLIGTALLISPVADVRARTGLFTGVRGLAVSQIVLMSMLTFFSALALIAPSAS
jgi:hypothetical protein